MLQDLWSKSDSVFFIILYFFVPRIVFSGANKNDGFSGDLHDMKNLGKKSYIFEK